MIHFHQVSKYFAGKRAVDNLTLQIAKGSLPYSLVPLVPVSRPR